MTMLNLWEGVAGTQLLHDAGGTWYGFLLRKSNRLICVILCVMLNF